MVILYVYAIENHNLMTIKHFLTQKHHEHSVKTNS